MARKSCKIHFSQRGLVKIKRIIRKKLLLVLQERNLIQDIKKAEALIMRGSIRVEGKIIDKPGTLVSLDSNIEIKDSKDYVSRGGLKLEGIFKEAGLEASGKEAIDIGSSTGGFTDYLLRNGAARIIAIDVNYGQFSWKLRNSPNIKIFERTNVRYLDIGRLPFLADITVVDVSFISIKTIFSKIFDMTKTGGDILLLVKPQFEVKKHEVGERGIIREKELHKKVLIDIVDFIRDFHIEIKKITFSKIKGAKGNIEFWIYLNKSSMKAGSTINYDKIANDIVNKAHSILSMS